MQKGHPVKQGRPRSWSHLHTARLGQDAGVRAGEQAGQGGDRLGRQVRGRATEAAVVDAESYSQAEQGLDGEEYGLPAGGNGTTAFELAELLARLADSQIQVISKLGHIARLLRRYSPKVTTVRLERGSGAVGTWPRAW